MNNFKKNKAKIIILILCMSFGAFFFIVQGVQFFTGRWNKSFPEEFTMLIFFLGVAIAPLFVLKSFVKKLTNNNNQMREEKFTGEEVDLTEESTDLSGGGTPDEDGEV